ncbi:MAG: CPBP family intramembrane glutamic endopeptidase [Desulfobacterales bacterium]
MLRKPVFWIVVGLLSVCGCFYALHFFPKAFPLLTVDLKMDRSAALGEASRLFDKYGWGPETGELVASFTHDARAQNFVELEAGGADAVSSLMESNLYHFYAWRVRKYKAHEPNEAILAFTPSGEFYGITEKVADTAQGAALSADDARRIAETFVGAETPIQLDAYTAIETSEEAKQSNRIDHTFVYQRKEEKIGDGYFRLKLVVSGDRVTAINHYIQVPETFTRRYEGMRSANSTIALGAQMAVFLLYGCGGVFVGLFFLLRKRWVLWKQGLYWGVFVAGLGALGEANYLPLTWMYYDTALSAENFFLRQLLVIAGNAVIMAIIYTVSFIAAESLTRRAFPGQIMFWKLWSPGASNSLQVLGRTVGGYPVVAFHLSFVVLFYMVALKYFGWWEPASTLFDPNIIATPFPWLSSVSRALGAGFWEECLFRAIPIAGAALIGDRFGRRKVWLVAALILQALIFGAGHANYATQPAYARMVELIIPSLLFAGLYISFGLLPAIISHFIYDVVLMSLPIFISEAPGIWLDRAMVILLSLTPVWVVLWARWKAGKWSELGTGLLNRAYKPQPVVAKTETKETTDPSAYNASTGRAALIFAAAGILLFVFFSPFSGPVPGLKISRHDAIKKAETYLNHRGIQMDSDWNRLVRITRPGPGQQDSFVWQQLGETTYHSLLGSYLPAPGWEVRFARFEGDPIDRAEEYRVVLDGSGKPVSLSHRLPEARKGAQLSETDAGLLAYKAIVDHYSLSKEDLKLISAEPSQKPARVDWKFIYRHVSGRTLEEGERRLVVLIAGDELTGHGRYVFVPEKWKRDEREKQAVPRVVSTIAAFTWALSLFCAGAFGLIQWSRKKITVKVFSTLFVLLLGLRGIAAINQMPVVIASFSTAQPYGSQLGARIGMILVAALLLSLLASVLTAFSHFQITPTAGNPSRPGLKEGLAVGAGLAGLFAVIDAFEPRLNPLWPRVSPGGFFLPWVSVAAQSFGLYITTSAFVTSLVIFASHNTSSWTKRKGMLSIVSLLMALMISGMGGVSDVPHWLVSGLIVGLVLRWVYVALLRFNPALTMSVVGVVYTLSLVNQGFYTAFPGETIGVAAAIAAIVGVNVYWLRSVAGKQR